MSVAATSELGEEQREDVARAFVSVLDAQIHQGQQYASPIRPAFPPPQKLEDLPPPAAPQRDCPKCRGTAIEFRSINEQSVATRCACVPECPRCLDSGTVTAIVNGHVRTGRCQCQRPVDRARLYTAAQIPGRYTEATLESYTRGLLECLPAVDEPRTVLPTLERDPAWLAEGAGRR